MLLLFDKIVTYLPSFKVLKNTLISEIISLRLRLEVVSKSGWKHMKCKSALALWYIQNLET